MTNTCEGCKFAHVEEGEPEYLNDVGLPVMKKTYTCRRYAPRPTLIGASFWGGEEFVFYKGGKGCGEYDDGGS